MDKRTRGRIRILHEILENGALSDAQILSLYSGDDVLNLRLARLVEKINSGESGGLLVWRAR